MNIQDFYIFKAVVQHGSFSKAAAELNYAQSNISMKIQNLEKFYNTTLFYRNYNGIRLTPKGETFHEMTLKMLDLYEKTRELMNDEVQIRGPLRIGSMETPAALHLPKLLTNFHHTFEDVDLTVMTGPSRQNIERVENYELDGAFIAGPVYQEKLLAKELVLEELVVISSENHPTIHDLKDMEEDTFIVFRLGCSYRAILEYWLNEEGMKPRKVMEFGTLDGLLGCVAAGLGVTLLPRSIAEKYRATIPLKMHLLTKKQTKVPTWFVYRNDEYQSKALERFLQVVEEYSI